MMQNDCKNIDANGMELLIQKLQRLKQNKYWNEIKKQKLLIISTGEGYTWEQLDALFNN